MGRVEPEAAGSHCGQGTPDGFLNRVTGLCLPKCLPTGPLSRGLDERPRTVRALGCQQVSTLSVDGMEAVA
jgi:hypothetical protein